MSRRQPLAGSGRGAAPRASAPRGPRPRTRGGRFPCQARAQPRSAGLRDNKCGSRAGIAHREANFKCRRWLRLREGFRQGLDRHRLRRRPLRLPEGRPGPAPCGAKGVAVVTCP